MYEQKEKPKENKSRTITKSVAQKKIGGTQVFGSNQLESIMQKKVSGRRNPSSTSQNIKANHTSKVQYENSRNLVQRRILPIYTDIKDDESKLSTRSFQSALNIIEVKRGAELLAQKYGQTVTNFEKVNSFLIAGEKEGEERIVAHGNSKKIAKFDVEQFKTELNKRMKKDSKYKIYIYACYSGTYLDEITKKLEGSNKEVSLKGPKNIGIILPSEDGKPFKAKVVDRIPVANQISVFADQHTSEMSGFLSEITIKYEEVLEKIFNDANIEKKKLMKTKLYDYLQISKKDRNQDFATFIKVRGVLRKSYKALETEKLLNNRLNLYRNLARDLDFSDLWDVVYENNLSLLNDEIMKTRDKNMKKGSAFKKSGSEVGEKKSYINKYEKELSNMKDEIIPDTFFLTGFDIIPAQKPGYHEWIENKKQE